MAGYLNAKAAIQQIDRELEQLREGNAMNCTHCSDLVDGRVAGNTYWCQHCNLPLCRRMDCISTHVKACEKERRQFTGDSIVDSDSRGTHYQVQELRDIAKRGAALNKLKGNKHG